MKLQLTDHELECLRMLSQGLEYKEIAHKLNFSVSYINRLVLNATLKLGALNTKNAIYKATKEGLI